MNHALASVAAIPIVFAGTALAQPEYSIEFLGPAVVINDMNIHGDTVGWLTGGNVQAFIAGPDRPHEVLPLPEGYLSAWAQGVNDDGVVVGSAAATGFPEFGQAIAWIPNGSGGYSIEFLGQLPGHTQSVAYDVNNRGDIVGSSLVPGFQGGPTVWFNAPGGILEVSSLGAPSSPKEINDEGVIVGINGGLFDIDTMTASPLPTFEGNMNIFQGWAINNTGELAGTAFHGGVSRTASIWTMDDGWLELSLFFGISADIIAFDINDSGAAVVETPGPRVYLPDVGVASPVSLLNAVDVSQWVFVKSFGGAVNNAGQFALIAQNMTTNESGVVLLSPTGLENPADLNGDGVVNGADLAAMLAQWGGAGSADLDGDGVVNGVDLAQLLASWT